MKYMLVEKMGGGGFVVHQRHTITLDKEFAYFTPDEVTNLGGDHEGMQLATGPVIGNGQRITTCFNPAVGIGMAARGEKTPDSELLAEFNKLPGSKQQSTAPCLSLRDQTLKTILSSPSR